MTESDLFVAVCAEVVNATVQTSFNIDFIAEDNTASSVGKCLIYKNCYIFIQF